MLLLAADRLPWLPALVLAGTMVPAGLLVAWLARRLARGDVGRNRVMGLRTDATMSSERAWDAGQTTFGPWGVAAGAGPVVVGLALLLRPPEPIALPVIMVSFAWLVGLVGIGAFLGDLAARDVDQTPSSDAPTPGESSD